MARPAQEISLDDCFPALPQPQGGLYKLSRAPSPTAYYGDFAVRFGLEFTDMDRKVHEFRVDRALSWRGLEDLPQFRRAIQDEAVHRLVAAFQQALREGYYVVDGASVRVKGALPVYPLAPQMEAQ